MKKQWILSFASLMILLPVSAYSGTFFEEEKTLRDPYIAEQGGFNSLFVNPAGTAGQSEFKISVHTGVRSSINDYNFVRSLVNIWDGISQNGLSREELSKTTESLSDLTSKGVLTQDFYEALFFGTTLDPSIDSSRDEDFWKDSKKVQAAIRDSSFTEIDVKKVEQNYNKIIENPSRAAKFFKGIQDDVQSTLLGTIKAGALIHGFGLGAYGSFHGTGFIDPEKRGMGVRDIYGEVGVVSGLGLNFLDGKIAVGASLNYGVLVKTTEPLSVTTNFIDFSTLLNDKIGYGYTWGMDFGMIIRPSQSFGFGVVFNDLIGTTEDGNGRQANGISDILGSNIFPSNMKYKLTLDADVGIFWEPESGIVKPKIGIDFLNVVGYVRDVAGSNYSTEKALRLALDNTRIGFGFNIGDVLDLGIQHYGQYTRAGIGLNLLFLGIYGELKIHDDVFRMNKSLASSPLGMDLTINMYF